MFHLFSAREDADKNSGFVVPQSLVAPDGFAALTLRTMRASDCSEWSAMRLHNNEWLKPWDSGDPMNGPSITYDQWLARQRRAEKRGQGVQFLMVHHGQLVGQISLGAICYGSMRTATAGYWVDQRQAGHGFAPLALAMMADWALRDPEGPRLHRIEIAILPENHRSRRVVEKLGIPLEGVRHSYMYVAGAWRDHEVYALLNDDVKGKVIDRLRS